jgi:hypothetical protein
MHSLEILPKIKFLSTVGLQEGVLFHNKALFPSPPFLGYASLVMTLRDMVYTLYIVYVLLESLLEVFQVSDAW